MRPEVASLVRKGALPRSKDRPELIKEWQELLGKITRPISDEEAEALIGLFPASEDDCFGLAWSLIHLVESSPNWPLRRCLENRDNPWIALLRQRLRNAGIEIPS
jgi:hypothetical protein